MLSADGSSSASSAWRSVSVSPATTGTSESPSRACDGYAAASDGWTVISGPDPARGQRMVVQDHVRGHQLGDAGDGHRPGRAGAVHHAEAADVGGRVPVGRPRNRGQPLLERRGRRGPTWRPAGETVGLGATWPARREMPSAPRWRSQPGRRVRPAEPGFPCAAGDRFAFWPAPARAGCSLGAYPRRCGTGFAAMSGYGHNRVTARPRPPRGAARRDFRIPL